MSRIRRSGQLELETENAVAVVLPGGKGSGTLPHIQRRSYNAFSFLVQKPNNGVQQRALLGFEQSRPQARSKFPETALGDLRYAS